MQVFKRPLLFHVVVFVLVKRSVHGSSNMRPGHFCHDASKNRILAVKIYGIADGAKTKKKMTQPNYSKKCLKSNFIKISEFIW